MDLGEDLRLDRDVQGGGRLVGDDDLGFVQQGDGDRYPLAHAAGELVRPGLQSSLRVGDTHLAQHLDAARARLGLGDTSVSLQGQLHLGADGQHRIERGHRVLEDHRQLAAPHGSQTGGVKAYQLLSSQVNRAADDTPRCVDQAQQRVPGDALARARLAHQTDGLSRVQVEAHPVHGLEGGVALLEMRTQIPHRHDRVQPVDGSPRR